MLLWQAIKAFKAPKVRLALDWPRHRFATAVAVREGVEYRHHFKANMADTGRSTIRILYIVRVVDAGGPRGNIRSQGLLLCL